MVEHPELPESLRLALAELEAYLVGEPPERLADHVLVLASTWTLGEAGLDLDRLAQDARHTDWEGFPTTLTTPFDTVRFETGAQSLVEANVSRASRASAAACRGPDPDRIQPGDGGARAPRSSSLGPRSRP